MSQNNKVLHYSAAIPSPFNNDLASENTLQLTEFALDDTNVMAPFGSLAAQATEQSVENPNLVLDLSLSLQTLLRSNPTAAGEGADLPVRNSNPSDEALSHTGNIIFYRVQRIGEEAEKSENHVNAFYRVYHDIEMTLDSEVIEWPDYEINLDRDLWPLRTANSNAMDNIADSTSLQISALQRIENYDLTFPQTGIRLTLRDYLDAGVVGVTVDNLKAVNQQILKAQTGTADTVAEIDLHVRNANAALEKIEAYNVGDGINPPPLTVTDYEAAGITGVNSNNIEIVNANVLAAPAGGADTVPEIERHVANAKAALDEIENYNRGNGTTPAPLTLQDYEAVTVEGVNEDNLAAVNAQVLAAANGGADSIAEVNQHVQNANLALAKIEAYNNGDGTTSPALSVEDYHAVGISAVVAGNLSLVNEQILAASVGQADTVPEINQLVGQALAILAIIENYNRGNGITPSAPSIADYQAAHVTGVNTGNLAAVNAQVLAAANGGADTTFEIQDRVSNANAALAKIEAYNNGDGATPPALTVEDYLAAGVTGVSEANLASVNVSVLMANTGDADTVPEIDALVVSGNQALAKIEAYNLGDGTTPPALALTDYQSAGIQGVTAQNLTALNAQVLGADAGGADSVIEVNQHLQNALAAIAKIEAFNNGDGTTPPPLSVNDYKGAGVTGVSIDNLAAMNAQVLAQNPSGADTTSEIQALVALANQAIAKVEAFNLGDGSTPSSLSVNDYQSAGVTGVNSGNLVAVNTQVLAAAAGGADTAPEIQNLADSAYQAIEKIEAYNQGNGVTPAAPNAGDYAAAGTTGVSADNLKAVNAQVLASNHGEADSVAEIQNHVQSANQALAKIEAYNQGNGTTPAALTVDDYAAAGIAGVDSTYLGALNAQVLAANNGEADTVAEIENHLANAIQALAKIEAYNQGDGSTPAALILTDYQAAGVTGVSVDNIAAVNAQVLKALNGEADSVAEVQGHVLSANQALAKIEAYNQGNGTTPAALTVDDYSDAGITGVSTDKLIAVNSQVLAAANGGADTSPEIQSHVQAADAALAKIEAYNQGDGTAPSALTVTDYQAAGITGVSIDNLAAVNAQVLDSVNGAADTVAEVQGLVANADQAIAKIEAYNQGNGTTPAPLNIIDYVAAGITWVNAGNLLAVNAQVLAANNNEADTVAEIQGHVSAADQALAKIEAYNEGDGSSPASLTIADYEAAGIVGVSVDNLTAVNAQVLAAVSGGADSVTEVEAHLLAANQALAKIEAYNLGDGSNPPALTLADYQAVGVVNVTADNLVSVNAQVLGANNGEADTTPEIQNHIQNAIQALAKVEAFNQGNGITPAPLTVDDYSTIGLTGVSSDNLDAVNTHVLAASDGGADTPAEVQSLVTDANQVLAKIEAYNQGNGTTPSALTVSDYTDAGISGVTVDNLAAVNAQVLAAANGGADTVPEVQVRVQNANQALAKIEAFNNGDGTTPSPLLTSDYTAAGITGVSLDNLKALNAQVLASNPGDTDTVAEIQNRVLSADQALAVIEAYNQGNGTTPAPLNVSEYAAAGISGVSADNLVAVNAQVLAAATGQADTVPEIESLVDSANQGLAKIEAYNQGNGVTPAPLVIADYTAIGITGVSSDNLAAVNAQVLAAANGGADSIAEIAAHVTNANQALAKIEAYNEGNGSTPAALNAADYAAAGIAGVGADNLAAVNTQVLSVNSGEADTVPEVNAHVQAANAALAKIEAFNNGNGTTPAPLNVADYEAAGIVGVTSDNLTAMNAQVLNAVNGGADTVSEVQNLLTLANQALAKIEAYNQGNGVSPVALTIADYTAIGENTVSVDNLAAVNAQVLAANDNEADSGPEITALIQAANLALAKVEAYNQGNGVSPAPLTINDYSAVGVNGVSVDNLAAVNAQVLAANNGDADTVPEILNHLQNANQALAKIEAYNQGNGTTPPALAVADYSAAGITGVSADNLAALNAQVLAAANGAANTVAEIQNHLINANQALAKIEAFNQGDGTNPSALTLSDYQSAGVINVTAENLTAVNAQVLAAAAGGADSNPEIQSHVQNAIQALAKIEAYNQGNGTTPAPLVVADYSAVGVTGVSLDNLAAVNAQVLAASSGGADSVAEVQGHVTAANQALAKIEAYNQGDGTTPSPLTLSDYSDAGITGVNGDNLLAANHHILTAANNAADTAPEIQGLVQNALQALVKIEAYNLGDGSTPAALLISDYASAAVTGVSTDNLAAVNAQVLAAASGGADTVVEVQAHVQNADLAIAKIEAYNQGNGTTPPALSIADYVAAGISGITLDNLLTVNRLVLAAANGGADSSPEIQAISQSAIQGLTKIEAYNLGDGTTPSSLTVDDYYAIGLNTVSADNLKAVNSQVLAAAAGEADSETEIESHIQAANQALAKIEAYNQGDGSTPSALTAQDYNDAGIEGVSADNLLAVNAQVLAANNGEADTVVEIEAKVAAANAAIQKIEAYNNNLVASLAISDYQAAGVTGVHGDNLSHVNSSVRAASTGGADSVPEIQQLVNQTAAAINTISIDSATGVQNDFLNAGDVATFAVFFSEAVTVTGTPRLAVNLQTGSVNAQYVSGSGTNTLLFSYTAVTGDEDRDGLSIDANSLSLNAGSIKDGQGEDASLSHLSVANDASYKLDANMTTILNLSLAEIEDGKLNKTELADGVVANVSYFEFNDGVRAGDTILITLRHSSGAEKVVEHTVTPIERSISQSGLSLSSSDFTETGEYTIKAQVGDPAGNLSAETSSISFRVDQEVSAPVISTVTDSRGPDTSVASGVQIDDHLPVIKGTAEADATVRIYQNNTFLTQVTTDSSGNWNYQFGNLSDGSYNISAEQTDSFGNASERSSDFVLNINETLSITEDSIYVLDSEFITQATAQTVSDIQVVYFYDPADGRIEYLADGKWVDIKAPGNESGGQSGRYTKSFTLAELDAGKVRYVPDENESGYSGYTAHGTGYGNGNEHYARLMYLVRKTDNSFGSLEYRDIDVTPVADNVEFADAPSLINLQNTPDVTIVNKGNGNFLTVWSEDNGDSKAVRNIYTQEFNTSLQKVGGVQTIISSSDHLGQSNGVVYTDFRSVETSNGYVLAWLTQYGTDEHFVEIKQYASNGSLLDSYKIEHDLNKFGLKDISRFIDIKVGPSGHFVLTLTSNDEKKTGVVVTFDPSNNGIDVAQYVDSGNRIASIVSSDTLDYYIYHADKGSWSIDDGQMITNRSVLFNPSGLLPGGNPFDIGVEDDFNNFVGLDLVGSNSVLLWQRNGNIEGRILRDSTGRPSSVDASAIFTVNQSQTGNQGNYEQMDAVQLSNGNFVVVWYKGDNYGKQFAARIFSSSGSAIGNEFDISPLADSNSAVNYSLHGSKFDVTALSNGGFVVGWLAPQDDNYHLRTFDAQGAPVTHYQPSAADTTITVKGNEDVEVALSLPAVTVTNSSETISLVTLSGIPDGYIISGQLKAGGAVSFTSGTGHGHDTTPSTATITDWDLSTLTVKAPAGTNEDSSMNLAFTTTVNGTSQITNKAIDLEIRPTGVSPLILDLDGDGVETLSVDQGVVFDINADGKLDQTGWVAKDDALLVRDIDNNGQIDDARELFGESTVKAKGITATDGFDALSELDINQDGKINAEDEAFEQLSLWQDSNSNGLVDDSELKKLLDFGVQEILLNPMQMYQDRQGNTAGLQSEWINTSGEKQIVEDIWFKYTSGAGELSTSTGTLSLADIIDEDESLNSLLDDAGLSNQPASLQQTTDRQIPEAVHGNVLDTSDNLNDELLNNQPYIE